MPAAHPSMVSVSLRVAACLAALSAVAFAQSGEISLVSAPISGQLDDDSVYSAVSDDGRFVAFATRATNVIQPDANAGALDVVLRDLEAAESILISQSTSGQQANGDSAHPAVGADGRHVIFQSAATNLAQPDANQIATDIFLRDRVTATTTLVSVSSSGVQGDGASSFPDISADGRYAVFLSAAVNLRDGQADGNGKVDAFFRDLATGATRLISTFNDGTQGDADVTAVAISGDGRKVVFQTASKLVSSDTNRLEDIYLWDRESRDVELVTTGYASDKASNGASRSPSIDSSGRIVTFDSPASNVLPDPVAGPAARRVYAIDLQTDARFLVSRSLDGDPAAATGSGSSVSADGRYVVFSSDSAGLVPNDGNGLGDVFLHDLQTGLTVRQSVAADGTEGNGASGAIYNAISREATTLAFRSRASNLVPNTDPGRWRIYARQRSVDDTSAPAIDCREVVADCSGADGAVVDLALAVIDDRDPTPTVTYDPPSGTRFPFGSTAVRCTATDDAGNKSTCDFQVTVRDLSPPEIECPAPIRVACSSEAGAKVDFTVSASDACDAAPTLTVDPPSGSTFPPGATDVAVVARDSSGNESRCTVRVLVVSAASTFIRGDSNSDSSVNITDAVFSLQFLFQGGQPPLCLDASDANDDGRVNVTDAVFILRFLFQSGQRPPAPGPQEAGEDPTSDELDCGKAEC